MLLTGDISSAVEPAIAAQVGHAMPLVLAVPHHGSKTSSSAVFIADIAPRYAVVSAGWHSRFGHPHPDVVARYAAAHVPLFNTADSGAVHVKFGAHSPPGTPERERIRQRRYWRE